MNVDLLTLCGTALVLGFGHTLTGPDHYVPFVAMSRVGKWPLRKTIFITLLCGIGHVGSSVVLGFIGIALGVIVLQLESIEEARGDVAGWLLVAFGLAYFAWGVVRAIRNRPHTHVHVHGDGTIHAHQHTHQNEHLHPHEMDANPYASPNSPAPQAPKVSGMTPWVLMTIFLFGPCEPLIPLLMYPAAEGNVWGVVLVTLLFGLATLVTMTTMVVVMSLGAERFRLQGFERYSHALAGLVVLSCGVAIKLGL